MGGLVMMQQVGGYLVLRSACSSRELRLPSSWRVDAPFVRRSSLRGSLWCLSLPCSLLRACRSSCLLLWPPDASMSQAMGARLLCDCEAGGRGPLRV